MRTLFFGDLQLGAGAPFGYGEYGEGSRFYDQELVLGEIAAVAAHEHVDVVCNLGDTFEYAKPAPWAVVAVKRFNDLLQDAGVDEQVVVLGNHDLKSAAMPSIIEAFGGAFCKVFTEPDVIRRGSLVFAVLPWTPISRLAASMDGAARAEVKRVAVDTLVQTAQRLRIRCGEEHPDASPVLLGHWPVSGSSLPSGAAIEEELDEPIIPWHDLDVLDFRLVALGHIHQPQTIAADGLASTPIFYVGSPAVCNFGEASSPHGVWLFDDEKPELRFVAINDRPFVLLDLDVSTDAGFERLSALSAADVPGGAVVRLRVTGLSREMARELPDLQQTLLDLGAHRAFVQTKTVEETRARVVGMAEARTPADQFQLWLQANGVEPSEALLKAHDEFVAAVA